MPAAPSASGRGVAEAKEAHARLCAELAVGRPARIDVLPVRGGEGFLRAVFEPLGYEVEAVR